MTAATTQQKLMRAGTIIKARFAAAAAASHWCGLRSLRFPRHEAVERRIRISRTTHRLGDPANRGT